MQTVLGDSGFMKSELSCSLVDLIFLLFRRLRLMEVFRIVNFKSEAFTCVEATGRLVAGDL